MNGIEAFSCVLETAPDAWVSIDGKGMIAAVNCRAEKLFGCARLELIGEPISVFLSHPLADPTPAYTQKGLLAFRRDGSAVPVEVSVNQMLPPLVAAGSAIVLRDVTERIKEEAELRRSEERLRELTRRLESVREEERTSLARQIHDVLGQNLTRLNMDLSLLQREFCSFAADRAAAAEATNIIRDMASLIDASSHCVRRIATELRPAILDDVGLIAALECELRDFQRRSGLSCVLTALTRDSALDAGGSTTMFRIFQEILTNAVRHSGGSRVEVVFSETAVESMLVVRDNGRGITDQERNNPRSVGLLGMRERARLRDGDVQIQGAANGTTITVRLPVSAGTRLSSEVTQ